MKKKTRWILGLTVPVIIGAIITFTVLAQKPDNANPAATAETATLPVAVTPEPAVTVVASESAPPVLSVADETAAATLVESFITTAGTFGVRPESFTGNLIVLAQQIANDGPAAAETFTSRQEVLTTLQNDTAPGSELWSLVLTPDVDMERDQLLSYRATNVNVHTPSPGARTINGTEAPSITFVADYDSTITTWRPSGTDSSWNGDYNIYAATVTGQEALIELVWVHNAWKIWSVTPPHGAATLAPWPAENPEDLPQFTSTGTLQTTNPLSAIP